MPSINVTLLQVRQANLLGEGLPDLSGALADDRAPDGEDSSSSPHVIVLAVVFSAIGTALLAFALARLWHQHRRRRGNGSAVEVDRSEFVPPPPPPYSLDPPPPFPAEPVVVANHVQATTHHGAYHDEVSERELEEIELLELPRRRERERREVEGQLRNSYYGPGLADCHNL
ncbi:hypothetical protein V8F33_013307 [Rhypophila sp. PSN 637]